MKVSLGLSFLLAFLDPGTCLQCEVCYSEGRGCSGPMKTCTGGEDTCGIILYEILMGEMAILSSIKSCVPSNMCNHGPVTMNYGMAKAKGHIACCTGDECRTTSVSLPPDDNVPNGYQCPVCFSADSKCNKEIVNCTGPETQCVDFVGLMNSVPPVKATMKGCTTISGCNMAGDGKNSLGMIDIKPFHCRPAFPMGRVVFDLAPQHTVFLPLLSGFILEKVLF
ncbi:phospholipase A2 inhibitor gamma subunit B-like [Manacus candei]|uniref:phospholipase A2 inhibitor gamma subunit B-like n=1 Tax=Manacus candei TaxID=415023 RepID=UPI002227B01F|nr:phospholipase A2 inhibitor gamma subunit B-like [Manacus candei]